MFIFQKIKSLLVNFLPFVFLGFLLISCKSDTGIAAYKVDELIQNPRIHEGKEIKVVGTLRQVDDALKIIGVAAKLEGSSTNYAVYLINFAARVEFDKKYVIKGEFATLTLPLFGSYLVIDAKSVQPCSELNIC